MNDFFQDILSTSRSVNDEEEKTKEESSNTTSDTIVKTDYFSEVNRLKLSIEDHDYLFGGDYSTEHSIKEPTPEKLFGGELLADNSASNNLDKKVLLEKILVSFGNEKHQFIVTDNLTFGELLKEVLVHWGLSNGTIKYELGDELGYSWSSSAVIQRILAPKIHFAPGGIPVILLREKLKKKKNKQNKDKQKPVKQRKKIKEGKVKPPPVIKEISIKEEIIHRNHIKENHVLNPIPIAPLILPKPPMDLHYVLPKTDILHKSLDSFPKTIDITPKPHDTLRPPEISAIQKSHHPPPHSKTSTVELMPLPQLPFTYS